MIGCLTTIAVGYLVSLLEPPPAPKQLIGLTWGRRNQTSPHENKNSSTEDTEFTEDTERTETVSASSPTSSENGTADKR